MFSFVLSSNNIFLDSAELKSTNERKAVIFSEKTTLHFYILFHPAGEILKHEKNSETLCDCVAFQRFAIYELCGIRTSVKEQKRTPVNPLYAE